MAWTTNQVTQNGNTTTTWTITGSALSRHDAVVVGPTSGSSELRINNIAVHPHWRGRGIGARLLAFLLEQAVRRGCEEATLEVRPSNEPALSIYLRAGFHEIGRRANYYMDTHEDAVVMRLPLGGQGPG